MAKITPLPFNSKPFQNVDPIVLDDASEALFDAFIDEFGNTNMRPGSKLFSNLENNKKIDGLFWWEAKQIIIAVSDGSVFKIINSAGDFVDITGDKLLDDTRPTFADNGNILVIANGGKMVTTDGTSLTAFIVDADAPTKVTHVAFLDFFLLANEVGTGRFRFTDFTTNPNVWFALDVFEAEANPDVIEALYVNRRTIYLYGTNSTEFWFNDGVTPFSRMQGTTIQRGVMSKYSQINVNETFYFFDDRRRLTRFEGNNPIILNTAFDETIQSFDTVDDCIADYITKDGKAWIIFTFPTEGRTLFYDLVGDYWAEWSLFEIATGSRDRYIGNAYVYARGFNKHLIGDFRTGKVYDMDSTFFLDDTENIHFLRRTGSIDHDAPDNKKRSYRINIRLKSGEGFGPDGNTAPTLRIRWRDNGSSVWGNYRLISLDIRGNREFIKRINNLGAYHSRQYELAYSDPAPFVMGKAFERLDLGEF